MTDLNEMREQYQTGGHSLAAATAYINGLEYENEHLKCCANCKHFFEDGYYGSHNDTTSESWSACRMIDDFRNRVEPSGKCVFTPSLWEARHE